MWLCRFLIALLVWRMTSSEMGLPLRDAYPYWESVPVEGEVGSRLILTPYIESGNIMEARKLSAVTGIPFPHDIPSYAGFFTVNKRYNSNLYFWFFPAEKEYETLPLLLWLQGGPGGSSLYGLFMELGPFSLAEDEVTLHRNPYSWHKNHSVIFIDNPVGTGFSFTDDEEGYATDQVQVGTELYSAITQFLTLFPELQKVPFFIAGESYAGKYIPALGYTIHQNNPTEKLKINLQGLIVGNGFTDPITLLHYSDFVYQLGLVDTNVFNVMKMEENFTKKTIQEGKFLEAFERWNSVMNTFLHASQQYNFYNFVCWKDSQPLGNYSGFLQKDHVRRIIHVGDTKYSDGREVYTKMAGDFVKSVRPWLEVLLDDYRVMYYSGQLDIMVAYALSVRMYNILQFGAAEEYRNATRVPWYVDGELAGYMKSAGKFTEVLVRNAGHIVPKDQPKWALDLINRFTSDNILKS